MSNEYYRLPLNFEELLQRRPLARCSAQESIAQHLYLMLTTHFGESRFDPEFGCVVWQQDFEAMTNMRWKDNVQRSVEKVIAGREPRLEQVKVLVGVEDFEMKGVSQRIRKRLEVTVRAVLHRTNEPFAFRASLFVAPLSVV
ncbi:GPW/gp25 family protein [Hymenobacter psychrotolerans]|uniref:Gene 25-like lysozyme n=1 Tax=Hymenobacter psychrotolerans DSM 18569 TaxID=1121959 RepID=A0A1M7DYX8_9BACT|nr:GPW/gp25 family protein [Hymenobacter psychrotolerans]SHL84692.1 Gene 25-like lysozyme [Hymenobacter psychrotolerans DSM 18569]